MRLERFIAGRKIIAVICILWLCNSCSSGGTNESEVSLENGTVHISVDETFKPVIDSQIQVFESSYPDAHVVVHYKPEADCLQDFAVDSIKMVIATRGYTENEEQFIFDSLGVSPSKMVIAKDAIAVVIHPGAADSLFTMDEIKSLLLGTYQKKLLPVLDGVSATSTVRFVIDSVLKGQALSSVVKAARSSQEVVDYVAKTPNAVGFIGVSWIGNKEDSTQLSYLKKVKVAQIESIKEQDKFVSPAQYNIYYRRYPMVRDLVYVLKEKGQGVAHGFAYFLGGQRGQLIFKRAYLMPVLMGFNVRNASLRE